MKKKIVGLNYENIINLYFTMKIEHKIYFWFTKTLLKSSLGCYVVKSQGPMENVLTSTLGWIFLKSKLTFTLW